MQCPKCQAENEDGRRFCGECGVSLGIACPDCGFTNRSDDKFCGGCGGALTTVPPGATIRNREAGKEQAGKRQAAEPERRQLTVMFCDLVGSTALAERLDPEDLRELLARYQDACAAAIQRYEGYIARYVGDGLLVYFGYPQAHEADAERSIRAGLGIVESIQALDGQIADAETNLAVRIGITTGLVVAGDIGSSDRVEEKAIVGETPNLAARLQGIAEPNTVVVGASTRRLVEGLFDYTDLGPQRLKGISGTVAAYRVRGESGVSSRFEAVAQSGLTPLVGREEEIGLLLRRWEQAKEGEGQVVLLSGEAGTGKSRIIESFRDRLGEDPHSRVLYYGSPYHLHSAFYPAIDQLARALRFHKDDIPSEKLDKLDNALSELGLPIDSFGSVLAAFLALPVADRYPPLALSPEEKKQRTLETLVAVVEAMANHNPVLMVVEDAQWLDPSTLEFLTLLVDQLRSKRFFMFVTFRLEFESPWRGHSHVTALTLNRLSHRDCTTMVTRVTGGKTLPREVLEQIVAKTDGVPLFVEELTKNLLESGLFEERNGELVLSGPLPDLAIPASLQDSLMARLDRLIVEVKQVAQLAATLGRIFNHEILAAVARLKDDALNEALAQLVTAGLVYRRGIPPTAAYEFKHALVQDVAYQSLLKRTRQEHHRRIARVLEENFPQIVKAQPELLAHHCTEAQLPDRAIGYWQIAAQQAAGRAGYVETLADLAKALDLMKTLPETTERAREEFTVYLHQAEALHFLGRRLEIVDLLFPHQERLERLGDASLAGQYYFWLGYAHSWLGNREEATRNLERSLEEAKRSRDKAILGLAHRALGLEYRYSGQLNKAVAHAREAVDLLAQTEHTLWLGDAAYTLSFNYYWIGQLDSALEAAAQLETIGKTIGSRRFQTLGAMMTGVTLATKGECEAGVEACRSALELAPDQFETAVVLACLGKSHLEASDVAQAVPVLEEAVELGDQVRSEQWRAWFRTLLAEAYLSAGQMAETREQVEEAFEISLGAGFPLGTGCSMRVMGAIAHKAGDLDEAHRHLDEAATVFQSVGAKFELARTYLVQAEVADALKNRERVGTCLGEARRLFEELQILECVERTQRFARKLGAAISNERA